MVGFYPLGEELPLLIRSSLVYHYISSLFLRPILCVKGVGDYPKEFLVGRRIGGKKDVFG
jgi:hypothetical protein